MPPKIVNTIKQQKCGKSTGVDDIAPVIWLVLHERFCEFCKLI